MISYDTYPGEKHLVGEFMDFANNSTLQVGTQQVSLFIWGYELWMPFGGRHGQSGIVDLLATDSNGNVWLIEAKHSLNTAELEPGLWEAQVLKYANALSEMKPEELVLQSKRYLTGNSTSRTRPQFVPEQCNGLLEAFQSWLRHLGVFDCEDRARCLLQQTFTNIKHQNVICSVLSDKYDVKVWEARPITRPCAYIRCKGLGKGFMAEVIIENYKDSFENIAMHNRNLEESWLQLKEQQSINPTPSSIRGILRPECREMYDFLLCFLKENGWDGSSYIQKSKSYVVSLPSKWGVPIKFMIGMVDYDASCHSIKEKLAGEGGFKCDIDLTDFKKDLIRWDTHGKKLAHRIISDARYEGRGAARPLKLRELSEKELTKWDGKLTHWPENDWRDFTGRNGDYEDLRSLTSVIQNLL